MNEDEKARSLALDYKQTYGTDSGKRVYEHMKRMTNFNIGVVPLDNNGKIDPYEVMRQEGMRSVIIGIETMLNKDPDEVKGIQNER
jgi:hypothetical protein